MKTFILVIFLTGAMADPDQKKSPPLSKTKYSCYYDWDCDPGNCCSTLYNPGCLGYCLPCSQDINEKVVETSSKLISPKCIEDFDCQGGFCCSALQPGLEGDCVPCGGGLVAKKGRKSLLCTQHTECPEHYCCWQDSFTELGVCVSCCISN